MNKTKETKEKICAFYASDYHFEMISLPYISEKLKENKEVIILTENNLEETINILLEKINLDESKKKNILKIDWKNDDLNKFKKIKINVENKKDTIVFIKGKENYIKNINENIDKWTEKSENLKVIDCFDISEIEDNIEKIMDNYRSVLKTTGEKEINKI